MEKVVKGIMGYSPEKEGKPATHMILTIEEYSDLIKRLSEARYDANESREQAKLQIEKYKKQCLDLIKAEKDKAQNDVKASQDLLGEAKSEINRLTCLNENLLRISRERANAKRGIKPKKVHHGYIVLDNQQSSYNKRFYNGRRIATRSFPCWKLRIQSPYDSSIPFSVITKNIHDDLINTIAKALDIKSIYKISSLDNTGVDEVEKLWNEEGVNFIFNASYKSNYRTGLWEVEYLVRASVIIPEDMRVTF